MNISTGQDLQVFYTTSTGNNSPSFSGYQEVLNIAVFPVVTQTNAVSTYETYDSLYASVLTGDKAIESFPITVNYVIDDPSHTFLEQAVETQSLIQIKIKYQSDEINNTESFVILNGYVSSDTITGSKDSVVQKSYTFNPETLIAQGVAEVQPFLRRADYGVGSNGIDAPQFTPEQGQYPGNGFIQIPSSDTSNPASTNLIGIGLTNNNNEAGFVMSETGDLRLYARNSSNAWTRIYSSSEGDTRYARLGQPANFGNLTINGTVISSGAITGTSFSTTQISGAWATVNNTGGSALLWRNTTSTGKANESIGINSSSDLVFTKANDLTSNTATTYRVYHEGFKPTKSDVGLGNVTNDAQLKIASNLSDVADAAVARTNLGVYSKPETVNLAARYTLPIIANGTRSYLKIASLRDPSNSAAYFNINLYGANNYGSMGSNFDFISVTARGIGTATTSNISNWVTHKTLVSTTGGRVFVGMHLVDPDATVKIWDVYLIAPNGFYNGTGIEICDVVAGNNFITGFVVDRIMPSWTTTNPTGMVTASSTSSLLDSTSIIPIAQGGTGATTAPLAATALGLGTTSDVTFRNLTLSATDPKLTIGSAILRSNSASQLVISAPQGIFLRPKGDTDSTVQMRYDPNGALTLTGTDVSLSGQYTSTGNITLSNTNTDSNVSINGMRLRATPAGVGVFSTPNQAINIRPKGDTDTTQTVIIDPANANVSLNGMGLYTSNASTFNANVTINNGLSVRTPIRLRPASNNDWANIGLFDADDTTQRGALWADSTGSIGLMARGGKSISYSNTSIFSVAEGDIRVGINRGGKGEQNDSRIKAQFFNKGYLELYGSNAYQEGGNGPWRQQVNGIKMIQQDTSQLGEIYHLNRINENNATIIHTTNGSVHGFYEFRHNGEVLFSGSAPLLSVGAARMHNDGNLHGSIWSNSTDSYLRTWLGQNGVSDVRMKENFEECEGLALDKVKQIEFVQFDWNEANKPFKNSPHVDFGWKAQQLEEIDPGLITKQYGDNILNPDLSTILPLAFKSIQELADKNAELEKRLTVLEEVILKLSNK